MFQGAHSIVTCVLLPAKFVIIRCNSFDTHFTNSYRLPSCRKVPVLHPNVSCYGTVLRSLAFWVWWAPVSLRFASLIHAFIFLHHRHTHLCNWKMSTYVSLPQCVRVSTIGHVICFLYLKNIVTPWIPAWRHSGLQRTSKSLSEHAFSLKLCHSRGHTQPLPASHTHQY